jgi:hypothetical protein
LKRFGFAVEQNNVRAGVCRFCGAAIAGVWE